MVDLLPLIPAGPLAGALVMGLFGRRLPKMAVNVICCGSVLIAFILSAISALTYGSAHEVTLGPWLPLAKADWGLLLDPLSSVMILIITGIGFLIHLYSTGYMSHEGGYYRFFGYLNLFVFFMLLLVLANNYGLMFVGWEGVGLCSYLLIGFYFKRKSATNAGMKAFIVNRVGDAGFILGLVMMLATFGSLRFADINAALANHVPETAGFGALSVIAFLLFIGATGKSAQVPLFVWLPDAMEGPTPVSALIHAATMVTAGVYMVARANRLYSLAPQVLGIIAVIGAFTAILAASIAIVQTDIKRVLAYSTVSQLGFMFMALGVGAYWVAIFHLLTHAFFKALLFLGAGSVIHGMKGEQDMRKMGGLRHDMPITFWTMAIGAAAIAGIPGLAGFFSKDEILSQVYHSTRGSNAIYIVGLVTALLTAFYMMRLILMTFLGGRFHREHAHESPLIMTAPLVALALGAVMIGWPYARIEQYLSVSLPVPEMLTAQAHAGSAATHTGMSEWALTLAALCASLGGIALGRYELKGNIAGILRNGWYIDTLYDSIFVRGLARGGGTLLSRFDSGAIDGAINGTGALARFTGRMLIFWDTYVIDGLVRLTSGAVKVASYPTRVIQTGQMQTYAAVVLAGLLALLGVYIAR